MTVLTNTPLSIWKTRSFVILFMTALSVTLGHAIYNLALPLVVYQLTESSQMMGWMRAVEFLPNLMLALFIGVWVDRFDKKRWSQAMLIGQIVTILISYSALNWLSKPLYVLFPCAFMMTAFYYGYSNARMAMIKLSLPQEQQGIATSRMSSLYSLMETIGPVLSGALLLFSQLHQVFLLLAMLWMVAYWKLGHLRLTPQEHKEHLPLFKALREGWQVFYTDKNMVLITLSVMVVNTTDSMFWIQSIYFAKAKLSLSALEVSYMVAASGVGGVASAFVADKVRAKMGLGRLLITSYGLSCMGFALPVLFPSSLSLTMAFFWVSSIGLFSNICIWSYRQEAFSKEHLGRISGITGSLFKLLMPFGLAASGYWVASFGIGPVFYGCLVVQLGVTGLLLCSRVRRLV